jgi:hypothetical protein
MWVLISRAPRQDAAYWPGRRWLALLDAVAWPTLWAAAVIKAPVSTGLVGAVAVSLLVAIAARRSLKAILRNERYWFTTWRWGLALAGMAAVRAATKLTT